MSGLVTTVHTVATIEYTDPDTGLVFRDAVPRDGNLTDSEWKRALPAVEAEAQRRVENWKAALSAQPVVVESDPVQELVDVASQLDALEQRRDVLVEAVKADPVLVEAAAEIPAVAVLIADDPQP